MQFIEGLREIAPRYDAILCDVWGVLHNGVEVWGAAVDALRRFRDGGGRVVMITNAPRPAPPVLVQLERLGVPMAPDACPFETVVTSGDVTRALIRTHDPRVFHIGPPRDHALYDGLDVTLVGEDEAHTVVCTGPFETRDDETPEDYLDLWARLAPRGLPFLCANPDIVVERGHELIWCAGALARDYAAAGGPVSIAGKPHAPIYDEAMRRLRATGEIDRSRVLAIGDGLPTDVRGASDNGFDLLYVSAGIHAGEYGDADDPDRERMAGWLAESGAAPTATLPRLVW